MQIRKTGDSLKQRRQQIYRKPRFESLKHRLPFAVFIVTSSADVIDADDGVLSLREAIRLADDQVGPDVIEFAEELVRQTPLNIELTAGPLVIGSSLEIRGPGIDALAIDAKHLHRVFDLGADRFDVSISNLTIRRGATFDSDEYFKFENNGPAIRALNQGIITLDSVAVEDCYTLGENAYGGVSVRSAELIVRDSRFQANTTSGKFAGGGALHNHMGKTTVERSIFERNTTGGQQSYGGALFARENTLEVIDSEFSENGTTGPYSVGGAIAALFAPVTIAGSVLRANYTEGIWSEGGAVNVYEELTMFDSTVVENYTRNFQSNGGGVASSKSIHLVRTTISNNRTLHEFAQGGGVAIFGYVEDPMLLFEESDITENTSMKGQDLWVSTYRQIYEPIELVVPTRLIGKQRLNLADAAEWRLGPPEIHDGSFLLTVSHIDNPLTRLLIETDYPWSNPLAPSDINNDGNVSPLDALVIINELARRARTMQPSFAVLNSPELGTWRGLYFDQNQDGSVSPLDALRVINELGRANRAALGEQIAAPKLAQIATLNQEDAEIEHEYFERSVPLAGQLAFQDSVARDLVLETFGLPPSDNQEIELALLSSERASSNANALVL